MDTKHMNYERFSCIWKDTRYIKNKSQDYMATRLGVTRKTIQNWENGISSPSLYQASMWFAILDINPIPYYMNYMFPHHLDESEILDNEKIKTELHEFINQSSEIDNRMLLFVISGEYGTNYKSLLQLIVAFCHLNLKDRHLIANQILNCYEISEANGELICKNNVLPNIELFKITSEEAKKVLLENKNAYSLV